MRAVHGVYDGDIYWCVMGINNKTTFEPPKERVFTNTASVSALIDPENDEVSQVHEAAKRLENALLQHARKDANIGKESINGHRALNVSVSQPTLEEKKEKEKRDKDFREAIKLAQKALEDQLEAIQKEINRLQNENTQLQSDIDENKVKLQNLSKENTQIQGLLDRLENGEGEEGIKNDETYKKAAEQYRKATGKDPDKIGVADLLLWQQQRNDAGIKGLNADNDAKTKQIEENKDKIEELKALKKEYERQNLEAEKIQDPVLKERELKKIGQKLGDINKKIKNLVAVENVDVRSEQKAIQHSHDGVENRADLNVSSSKLNATLSTESEIESFMKELAKSQSIENRMEKLAREQELVVGLSTEAADQLSMDKHTEELFSPDYFKPLEGASTSLAKSSPAFTANLSLG